MTGATLHIAVTPIQREARIGMIEGRSAPTFGSMAGATIRAELSVVGIS